MDTIYLDLETTGLSDLDEILEIAIIDDAGKILLNALIQPERHQGPGQWKEAQAINGITWDHVKRMHHLDHHRANIKEIARGRRIVIYNADFDHGFLIEELEGAAEIQCCMTRYADLYYWNDYFGSGTWQKLSSAAAKIGHRPDMHEAYHRALADTRACRSVWTAMETGILDSNGSLKEDLREYRDGKQPYEACTDLSGGTRGGYYQRKEILCE